MLTASVKQQLAVSNVVNAHIDRVRGRGTYRRHVTRTLAVMMSLSVVATGCSSLGASRVGDIRPAELPVTVTSMSTIYGIQLDLRGSVAVRDGWVYVDLPAGAAKTYQGRASAWDLVVRAGIATCNGPDQGRLIAEGRAGRIAPLVGLTRDNADLDTIARTFVAPLRLDVGIPPGADLSRSWVTLDVSWPVEATIASYTLTATDALTPADSDGAGSKHARGRRSAARSPIQEMEILHSPPVSARCT